MVEHSSCFQEGRTSVRKSSVIMSEEDLVKTLSGYMVQGKLILCWATNMMAWMTLQPSPVNGTELVAQ